MVASLLFSLVACAARGPALSDASAPPRQVDSFDHAWSRVAETYYDPDMRGVDWVGIREELRPRAVACESNEDLRPVLEDMLSRLGESHFTIVPAEYTQPDALPSSGGVPGGGSEASDSTEEGASGDVGIELRLIDNQVVITRIREGSPAEAAGLHTGWALLRIDDLVFAKVLADLSEEGESEHTAPPAFLLPRLAMRALRGEVSSEVEIEALDGDEEAHVLTARRQVAAGVPVQLGFMPELNVHLEETLLESGVGLIHFNAFMIPVAAPFTQAVVNFVDAEAKGVVIDLRGNPGGIVGLIMGMGGHFFGEAVSLGHVRQRHLDLELNVNPRVSIQRFEGPVAILVDELSASTSEVMAAGMQSQGRARVFGTPSAGMALPSIFESLPNGDGLQMVIGDLTGPGGIRLEGEGVQPDAIVHPTRSALLDNRDPALDAAVTWILETANPPESPTESP